MTIASEIIRIQSNIAAAYTAASGKGATLPATENSDNLATCIGSISGGGSTGIYKLLDRVEGLPSFGHYEEVGTVVGFFNKNNVEYAVVCLDAIYRKSGVFGTSGAEIQNLPIYNNIYSSSIWGATETGTENTEIIINNYSSQTLNDIYLNRTIYIGNVDYHEVLPNIQEAAMIAKYYAQIENKDTSSGGIRFDEAKTLWTSNQLSYTSGSTTTYTMWTITDKGYANGNLRKNQNPGAVFCPVLEIPNT
jgi:hypothetical protein